MYRHIINSDSGGVMPLTFDKKTQTLSLVKKSYFSGFKHCFIHVA